MIASLVAAAAVGLTSGFEQARWAALDGDYVSAAERLKDPGLSDRGQRLFYTLIVGYRMNDRASAQAALKELDHSLVVLPRRQAVIVDAVRGDVAGWKDGDLADVGRDMTGAADRLASGRGGKRTQELQAGIVAKLDKLIRDQEDPKQGESEGEGKGDPAGQSEAKGKGEQKKPRKGLRDSEAADENRGAGKVDERKLRKYVSEWGGLPAAERARAVQEITRDLPAKYRHEIEAYFQSLSKLN